MMPPPIIGITTYSGDNQLAPEIRVATAMLPTLYIDAVLAAGGIPVLLPPGPPRHAAHVIQPVNGIILPGGPDVNPAMYGQPIRPETSFPDVKRDAWEFAIFANAVEQHIPVLGICRGMQIMNVTLGGTLHQHIEHPEIHGGPEYITHDVMVLADSFLGEIHEDRVIPVTTRHHQAIDTLGVGLKPVAWAEDGTIEAVEHDFQLFAIGVQWHPERDKDQSIFAALVEAASMT